MTLEAVPAPVDPLAESSALAEVRDQNRQRLEDFARRGVPFDFRNAMLGAVLDELLPRDSERRLEFELRWERFVTERLASAESEIRKAELLEGVNGHGR